MQKSFFPSNHTVHIVKKTIRFFSPLPCQTELQLMKLIVLADLPSLPCARQPRQLNTLQKNKRKWNTSPEREKQRQREGKKNFPSSPPFQCSVCTVRQRVEKRPIEITSVFLFISGGSNGFVWTRSRGFELQSAQPLLRDNAPTFLKKKKKKTLYEQLNRLTVTRYFSNSHIISEKGWEHEGRTA